MFILYQLIFLIAHFCLHIQTILSHRTLVSITIVFFQWVNFLFDFVNALQIQWFEKWASGFVLFECYFFIGHLWVGAFLEVGEEGDTFELVLEFIQERGDQVAFCVWVEGDCAAYLVVGPVALQKCCYFELFAYSHFLQSFDPLAKRNWNFDYFCACSRNQVIFDLIPSCLKWFEKLRTFC